MRHRVGTFLLVVGLGVLAWPATVYHEDRYFAEISCS
jgi:hypothetical protein